MSYDNMSGGSHVKPAELYKTTIAVWTTMILLSSVVFHFAVHESTIFDAILEATAAWTGTGISAFDSASTPLWLQLFRSACNWLGGIGIVMISLTIIRPKRFRGWQLAATEFPGPYFLKSESDFRRYYRRIALVYVCFSVIQFLLLLLVDMDPIQAAMTALSNSSSSGLHHINNGFVTALPTSTKAIITVFAFLSSLYSPLFLLALHRKWKRIKESSELNYYVARIVLVTVVLSGLVISKAPGGDYIKSISSVFMQVISSLSTSGYVISDMSAWPLSCVIIISLMIFTGACSFSTGGGFKVSRLIIALKMIAHTLYKQVHPNSVRPLKYDKKPLKSESVVSANLFIALFMITYLLGALLLSLDKLSLLDSLSYSQAMLTGSGIPLISPEATGLADGFSSYGKVVLSALMVAGRLEIYPLLMIFFESFWKTDSSL